LDPVKTIKDPTEVLRAQIKGQKILETAVIQISTSPLEFGGIVNIPFLIRNANATQMDAIFWIEKVQNPTFPDREIYAITICPACYSGFREYSLASRVGSDFGEGSVKPSFLPEHHSQIR
jgi:hypothetical protein